MTIETNIIARRKALEPQLLKIMSTPQGQAELAAFISEIADELRLLSDAADARAERERCTCCICSETETKGRPVTEQERKQLWAAMRAAC